MLVPPWLTLVVGIPIIVWLSYTAVRRIAAIRTRMAEVRRELERNPQPPYAALADLMAERAPKPSKRRKEKRRG